MKQLATCTKCNSVFCRCASRAVVAEVVEDKAQKEQWAAAAARRRESARKKAIARGEPWGPAELAEVVE